MELVASGLRQGLTFSTTLICRYFSLRFVPGTNGRFMRVELSVPPATICPSFGYLNWKAYVEFVKVSQSPGIDGAVAVKVGIGPAGVMEGVRVISATMISTATGSFAEAPMPNWVPEALRTFHRLV